MTKKRFGDRKDATKIRDIDPMHFVMANVWPRRNDNEAFIMETIDLEKVNAYLEKKNLEDSEYHYNVFQVLVTAIAKTITLRPKLNRFITNGTFYQKDYVSTAFVVKKEFSDTSAETVAYLKYKDSDNIDTVHNYIKKEVTSARSDKANDTDATMDILNKIPSFIAKFIIRFVRWLDKHGWVPESMVSNDGAYSSCFITNLGSIQMQAGYHHLFDWGTCSFFCTIGAYRKAAVYDDQGNVTMRDVIDIGCTVDERIADGYYFAKSIKLIKYLLENPELLEKALNEEVSFQ